MSLLDVHADGLAALAAHCDSPVGQLTVPAIECAESAGQPTVAAVTAVQAGVVSAASAMAARVQGTAALLATTGTEFVSGDEESAAGLVL